MYHFPKAICDLLIQTTGVYELSLCLPPENLPYLTNGPLRAAQNNAMAAILPLSGARGPIIPTLVRLAEPITIQGLIELILAVACCAFKLSPKTHEAWAKPKAKRRLLRVVQCFVQNFRP